MNAHTPYPANAQTPGTYPANGQQPYPFQQNYQNPYPYQQNYQNPVQRWDGVLQQQWPATPIS